MRELKAKNPRLGDDLRVVRFRAGRYENYWKHNVVGIGNSSGFAEPLEATALQHIAELCKFMCRALRDSGRHRITPKMQELENRRFRWLWDDLRDFLAIHYKFNRRLDTPFWRHCREKTCLAGAEEIVDYYRDAGPSILGTSLVRPCSIFGYNGYLCLLIGQQVETRCRNRLDPDELRIWAQYQDFVRKGVANCVDATQAIKLIHHPAWQWPKKGT
jgi:tryptophan 7-halogenase